MQGFLVPIGSGLLRALMLWVSLAPESKVVGVVGCVRSRVPECLVGCVWVVPQRVVAVVQEGGGCSGLLLGEGRAPAVVRWWSVLVA